MIEIRNVSKKFFGQTAVQGVSLHLEARKTHVILGQSGSGKSTLIRIAAGLISPDSGEVLINGRAVSQINNLDRARTYGFMVQDGGLFPHLTCRKNIMLPAEVHRAPLF